MASSICNACLELARVSRVAEVSEVVLLFLLSSSCMRYSESTDTVAGAGNCAPSPHSPHSHGAGHCDTALVTDGQIGIEQYGDSSHTMKIKQTHKNAEEKLNI